MWSWCRRSWWNHQVCHRRIDGAACRSSSFTAIVSSTSYIAIITTTTISASLPALVASLPALVSLTPSHMVSSPSGAPKLIVSPHGLGAANAPSATRVVGGANGGSGGATELSVGALHDDAHAGGTSQPPVFKQIRVCFDHDQKNQGEGDVNQSEGG